MKLIIEVTESVYKMCQDWKELKVSNWSETIIANGTPTTIEEHSIGEWISITERLPKDDEDVLVTYTDSRGYSFVEMVWFDEDEGKFFSQDGKFEIVNVVAWMPSPEPYKEGDV